MPDFLSATGILILILAFVFAALIVRKLLAPVSPPVKRSPAKAEMGEPQVEEEHIAIIYAVLPHYLGATPESICVTRIKPL